MTTGMNRKQLREIVRAKMNVIEKERAEFQRFRDILAQEDPEMYLRVGRLWLQEKEEASS